MCTCVYVYMYCVRTRECVRNIICMYMICECIHPYVFTHILQYDMCMYTIQAQIYTYVYIFNYKYICIYIYTRIYIYMIRVCIRYRHSNVTHWNYIYWSHMNTHNRSTYLHIYCNMICVCIWCVWKYAHSMRMYLICKYIRTYLWHTQQCTRTQHVLCACRFWSASHVCLYTYAYHIAVYVYIQYVHVLCAFIFDEKTWLKSVTPLCLDSCTRHGTYEWVMSHAWMTCITCECTYNWVISHIDWVMSHILMSHVTCANDLVHMWRLVPWMPCITYDCIVNDLQVNDLQMITCDNAVYHIWL